MMNRFSLAVIAALMLAGTTWAQERVKIDPSQTFVHTDRIFISKEQSAAMAQVWERLPEGKISMFSAELAGGGELVKDAPYTATAVTESTQTLADGNRIVNKNSAFVARDSQGRTRREQAFDRLGALNMQGGKMVFISDPTAHTDYVLNPDEQQARVLKRDNMKVFILDGPEKGNQKVSRTIEMRHAREEGAKTSADESSKQVKHEQLGTQEIEGVSAEGTRETVTIPAGQIGNDRPIEIISENWYSADLHTVVLRKHSDPRFGETTFRLTDIKHGEPDPSLFQVPAGFKTTTAPDLQFHELPRQKLPKD